MKKYLIALLCLGCSFIAYSNNNTGSNGNACLTPLMKVAHSDSLWREPFTHTLPQGMIWQTDAKRENFILKGRNHMLAEIRGTYTGHSDTPPMMLFPTDGSTIRFTQPWEEYGPMVADVYGASDGKLRFTVLLPVSGHTGIKDATKWAKTDTYSLKYDNGSGNLVTLIKDATSLDFITAQEMEIPLIDGKTVILYYYRSGSGGPSGYDGGRTLKLTWQKGKVDKSPYDPSEKFW